MDDDNFSDAADDFKYHEEKGRIQQRLNRLYWMFMLAAMLFAAYCIGWYQGFTS